MGRHKGFTVEDYRKLAEQGYSISEAAYLMGVRQQTVSTMAKRHDIKFADGNQRRMYRHVSAVLEEGQGSYKPTARMGGAGGEDQG